MFCHLFFRTYCLCAAIEVTGFWSFTCHVTYYQQVCTNPAGTTLGKNSKPILTKPAPPQAPVFLHAKASSIFIRFQENSRGGKQVVNKLTIGVAKAGPADPFAKENEPGLVSDESSGARTLKQARIVKLKPGTLYVFRLTVSNAAGSATGPISAPMLTVPQQPARLREDSKKRTSDSVTLKFAKHGQHLTHLTLQYALLSGAKKRRGHFVTTFDQLMAKGGKQEPIPYPQQATEYTVKGLEANKKYVFRLTSKNKSGIAIGTVLGPITTDAPEVAKKNASLTEEIRKRSESGKSEGLLEIGLDKKQSKLKLRTADSGSYGLIVKAKHVVRCVNTHAIDVARGLAESLATEKVVGETEQALQDALKGKGYCALHRFCRGVGTVQIDEATNKPKTNADGSTTFVLCI